MIKQFGGMAPKIPEHLLSPGMARVAHNVDLRAGNIRPWRERLPIASPPIDTLSFLLYDRDKFVFWNTCVEATDYLPDYGRIYLTGRSATPEVMVKWSDPPIYFKLGVPRPIAAPIVSATETLGDESDARSYVYCYVNVFGEDSAPSLASRQITVKAGDSVIISGFSPPPEGYGITGLSLYRTGTGIRRTAEEMLLPMTTWLHVADFSITMTSYEDAVLTKDLGTALDTEYVHVPPDNLRQITHIKGTGTLVGKAGNKVYFSGNYQPWNWPEELELTFPHNIINIVTVDQFVYVTTESRTYVINAEITCSQSIQSKDIRDTDCEYPDLGCGSPHSAVATPFGIVYPSTAGLVMVNAKAAVQVLTSPYIGAKDWILLRPDTVRLAYWLGCIFCVTETSSFIINIDPKTFSDSEMMGFSTISDKPVNMFTTDSGEILMLEDGIIYQWNAGDRLRPYKWESAFLEFPGNIGLTVGKVWTEGTQLKLFTDWDDTFYERFVTNRALVRLPRLGRHSRYRIGFEGVGKVEQIRLDTGELNLGAERSD
jgi:hypothetical protein